MTEDLIWQLQSVKDIEALRNEQLRLQLIAGVNDLLNNDFEKLVFLLYRIDVHEEKLRYLLNRSDGENAAETIADLLIERQAQKIESRKTFKQSGEGDW